MELELEQELVERAGVRGVQGEQVGERIVAVAAAAGRKPGR